jgi:hypothetical protein
MASATAAAPTTDAQTPTPTPTPSALLISGSGFGPLTIGGSLDALLPSFTGWTRDTSLNCPNPAAVFLRHGSEGLTVMTDPTDTDTIVGIEGGEPFATESGATTGTTLAELRAHYPAVTETGSPNPPAFEQWTVPTTEHAITFELDEDNAAVGGVWVGVDSRPPFEVCS